MLFSARDLRSFYRGLTAYESDLMGKLDFLNAAMKQAAQNEKRYVSVNIELNPETAMVMSREITHRLSQAGYSIAVKPIETKNVLGTDVAVMPITIDWF